MLNKFINLYGNTKEKLIKFKKYIKLYNYVNFMLYFIQ